MGVSDWLIVIRFPFGSRLSALSGSDGRKVGINGARAIGRNIMRAALGNTTSTRRGERLTNAATLAKLIKYDSVPANCRRKSKCRAKDRRRRDA